MSPEEVRVAVEAALRADSAFPWWSYAVAFVASVAGAYLGAYVVKSAQDRATQDNFDRLREQLRRTTEDTEAIKTALARRTWVTQQQWSVRERQYGEILSHLTKLRISLDDRAEYFQEPGSEHSEVEFKNPRFQDLAKKGYASQQAIRELLGQAAIFLSSKSIERLEHLAREHRNLAEYSMCTADYVAEAGALVSEAYEAVLLEAKTELAHAQGDA